MPNKIPSLGDEETKKLRLIHGEVPLPSKSAERIRALENIIALGLVQKIVIEVGKPIRFTRFVEGAEDPTPAPEDDAFNEIRNAKIEEFVFETQLPIADYLFRAFRFISSKRLKATAFVLSNMQLLKENLGISDPGALEELFGVEVIESEQVPPDVLLLVSKSAGEREIALTLRLLLNPPKRKK